MLVNLIQCQGKRGVFNYQKCVCTKSSNLLCNKFFRKFSFQSLFGLLLMNSIVLSLLFLRDDEECENYC